MTTNNNLPTSNHFRLTQLADGVYAAIAIEGTGSGSNAGIIDLGERTLVFDTFLTPQAGDDLHAAAEQLLGRPVAYVINSHFHADHVHGNQAFGAETVIISTGRTRELLETRGAKAILDYKTRAQEHLQSLEAKLAAEQDEQERKGLALQIAEDRELIAAAPRLALRLPDQTFEERLVFHGSKRSAELLCYGGGHTDSDAFLVLPNEKLAFMGDLLFVQSHLWIGDGHPEEWLRILGRMPEVGLQTVVPGHGPIGTPEDFQAEVDYIKMLEQIVARALKSGKSAEEAQATPIPEAYANWAWREGFGYNIGALYKRASRGAGA